MVHRDEGAGFGGTGFGDQVRRFGGSGLSRALASGSGGHAGGYRGTGAGRTDLDGISHFKRIRKKAYAS
jgi:hypothetical protein